MVLENLDFYHYSFSDLSKKMIYSKYTLDKSKIYTPYIDENNKILIKTKLYNNAIKNFYELNGFDTLNKLTCENKLYCLFDINIYVKHNQVSNTIEYININLSPIYINKFDDL